MNLPTDWPMWEAEFASPVDEVPVVVFDTTNWTVQPRRREILLVVSAFMLMLGSAAIVGLGLYEACHLIAGWLS